MTEGVHRRLVVIAQPDMSEVDEFVALFDAEPSVEVDVILTRTPDAVEAAMAEAIRRGADSVASVGGDGAVNIVAAAIVRAGSDMVLAPVPAGTVNLATQVFGLRDPEATADAVIADRWRIIDVAETEQGTFVLNASTGFDAGVIVDADGHSDVPFGRLAFALAGLRRLRRVSDSLSIAPDAVPDDGVLDVVVVRADTVRRMASSVWRLITRREVPERDIVRGRGVEVRVDWATTVPSQRDGDADEPVRSMTATCRPGALRVHHHRPTNIR